MLLENSVENCERFLRRRPIAGVARKRALELRELLLKVEIKLRHVRNKVGLARLRLTRDQRGDRGNADASSDIGHDDELADVLRRTERRRAWMGLADPVGFEQHIEAQPRDVEHVKAVLHRPAAGNIRFLQDTDRLALLVDVTIGVPDPGAVDTSAVATELPYGTVTVTAVKGGLEIAAELGGDAIIIANAAVIVSLDDGMPG